MTQGLVVEEKLRTVGEKSGGQQQFLVHQNGELLDSQRRGRDVAIPGLNGEGVTPRQVRCAAQNTGGSEVHSAGKRARHNSPAVPRHAAGGGERLGDIRQESGPFGNDTGRGDAHRIHNDDGQGFPVDPSRRINQLNDELIGPGGCGDT